MNLRADLHLHSCLSPCGSLEMSPLAMARAARAAGLDAVAITDHNCARNAPAFAEACRRYGLHALLGVEANTSEELHALCLFDCVAAAVDFGDLLLTRLAPIPNRPEKMGDQPVVDIDENIIEEIPTFLGGALDVPLSELCALVKAAGGLFIPSHIDRSSFSLMSQLGRIPDLPYDALEVTPSYRQAGLTTGDLAPYALIYTSDAHYLSDIGRRYIEIECPRFDIPSIRTALRGARRCVAG